MQGRRRAALYADSVLVSCVLRLFVRGLRASTPPPSRQQARPLQRGCLQGAADRSQILCGYARMLSLRDVCVCVFVRAASTCVCVCVSEREVLQSNFLRYWRSDQPSPCKGRFPQVCFYTWCSVVWEASHRAVSHGAGPQLGGLTNRRIGHHA